MITKGYSRYLISKCWGNNKEKMQAFLRWPKVKDGLTDDVHYGPHQRRITMGHAHSVGLDPDWQKWQPILVLESFIFNTPAISWWMSLSFAVDLTHALCC